jgi:FRG domain
MYPLEHVYSLDAYAAWRRRERDGSDIELRDFRQSWRQIKSGPFWEVHSWNELRAAVSFLTLMNKRDVLYFRGQRTHYDRCLPVLFRDEWFLGERRFLLHPANRGRYYMLLSELSPLVLRVAKRIGTPRTYILERVPAAAASVLQHYELWPTHFIDLTRSLPIAVAFAEGQGDRDQAYLYAFAMPDLRGSITSDIDQHLTLSRLEAICPPDAMRPHHQDAYLVSRFPEPSGFAQPGDTSWDDWQKKIDLMRRIVAKFSIRLQGGRLLDAPRLGLSFLIPSLNEDVFGRELTETLFPIVNRHATQLD